MTINKRISCLMKILIFNKLVKRSVQIGKMQTPLSISKIFNLRDKLLQVNSQISTKEPILVTQSQGRNHLKTRNPPHHFTKKFLSKIQQRRRQRRTMSLIKENNQKFKTSRSININSSNPSCSCTKYCSSCRLGDQSRVTRQNE